MYLLQKFCSCSEREQSEGRKKKKKKTRLKKLLNDDRRPVGKISMPQGSLGSTLPTSRVLRGHQPLPIEGIFPKMEEEAWCTLFMPEEMRCDFQAH